LLSSSVVMPDSPDEPAPPEATAASQVPEAARGGSENSAPPVELIGERPDTAEPPRLIALISIGLTLSIAVHVALLGAGLIHLPRHAPPDEEALPVTVVPEPETAQPKTSQPETSQPETSQPPPPKPQPQTQAAPAQTTPPEPSPQTAAAAPASPTPAPPAPPAPAAAPQSAVAAPPPGAGGPGEAAVSDKAAEDAVASLRQQIERCWTVPTGWTNAHQVTVVLNVRLDRSGAVAAHPVLLEFSASALGMTAAKNALAAVARCAPYKLPPDKYSQWREAQVRLAPE
jgi:hypothetical protein